MKCPHCKKEIEENNLPKDMFGLFIFNCFWLLIPIGLLMSGFNRWTQIPMGVDDGLKANYYLLPMLIIALFYVIYILLYQSNKVKGRLLLYTYWIDKKR